MAADKAPRGANEGEELAGVEVVGVVGEEVVVPLVGDPGVVGVAGVVGVVVEVSTSTLSFWPLRQ